MDGGADILVLIATKVARTDDTTEWLDALGGIVTVSGGTLWHLEDTAVPGGPGPGHTHVVRLGSMTALSTYDRAVSAARRNGALPCGHGEVRRDVWHRHTPATDDAADHRITALIAAEVLCTDPDRRAEWDLWYDEQHLPDMMSSGAFVRGARWRREPSRPGSTNDLTLYEIAGLSIYDAITRSAAVMPELIAAGRKHECHCGGLTMALTAVG